jgi:crotonobetainyl-CoA:carnitine CoA-transferase CaiB-like acyl-CoA transferase
MEPLDGLVVLDMTRLLPGAIATLCLANFGAEVIKIEQPGSGDPARYMDNSGWLFSTTNAGKKSVAIDLKTKRGKELFYSLVEKADILVESFRPGVMARLDLDYEVLSRCNKSLIYGSISGYGQQGPYSEISGHDINYIALTGLFQLMGSDDGAPPRIPPIQIADFLGGSYQVLVGILLALEARHKTGLGQMIDVSMSDGLFSLLTVALSALQESEGPTASELLSGEYACYSTYPARNNRWIAVGALESKFWKNLCRELRCELLIDKQFAPLDRQREMKSELSGIFVTRDSEEWFALLRDKDCCVTPLRTLDEALGSGIFHEKHTGIKPSLSRTPANDGWNHAPRLGEHSLEILKKLDVQDAELEYLNRCGVIQCLSGKPEQR